MTFDEFTKRNLSDLTKVQVAKVRAVYALSDRWRGVEDFSGWYGRCGYFAVSVIYEKLCEYDMMVSEHRDREERFRAEVGIIPTAPFSEVLREAEDIERAQYRRALENV